MPYLDFSTQPTISSGLLEVMTDARFMVDRGAQWWVDQQIGGYEAFRDAYPNLPNLFRPGGNGNNGGAGAGEGEPYVPLPPSPQSIPIALNCPAYVQICATVENDSGFQHDYYPPAGSPYQEAHESDHQISTSPLVCSQQFFLDLGDTVVERVNQFQNALSPWAAFGTNQSILITGETRTVSIRRANGRNESIPIIGVFPQYQRIDGRDRPQDRYRIRRWGYVTPTYSIRFFNAETGRQQPNPCDVDPDLIYHYPDPPGGDDDMTCSCETTQALLYRIYQILGGNSWGSGEYASLSLNPEELIKNVGQEIYGGSEVTSTTVSDLTGLNVAIASTLFHRGGYHRLPASLPDLAGDDEVEHNIPDAITLQEWLIKQLDVILGHFPVKVQVAQEDGSEQVVKIDSISDAFSELAGILLGIAEDANLSTQLASRAMIEASKAGNASLIAQDYSRANAEYLGYSGSTVMRNVQATFTVPTPPSEDGVIAMSASNSPPAASTALNSSSNQVPGWQWNGDDSLQATLNQILIGIGIIKAANVQRYEPEGRVTGDAIRDDADRDGEDDDTQWQTFLQERRLPPPNRRIANAPTPEIRDVNTGDDP